MQDTYDIIVIGGGVAGMSAAIHSSGNRLKTIVIDKGMEFGSLAEISHVGDFPGIDGKVSGSELLGRIKRQATNLGTEFKTAIVTSCNLSEPTKKITTNEPHTYEAGAVVLATGNMPHHEGHSYQGEKKYLGKGVSHEVDVNISACRNVPVAVVGKSQTCAESVLKLAAVAENVCWIVPASKIDVSQTVKNEIERTKKIEIFYSSSLKQINGANEVNSITILSAGQEKTLNVRQIFLPATQHKPVTDYLNGSGIQTSQDGVILVGQILETNLNGVFAAGDVLCMKQQSPLICSAQGVIAAMGAEKFLKK